MPYIQQSLGSREKVLMEGRFHWMYTVSAAFWVLAGFGVGIAIGYVAIWWSIHGEIGRAYGSGLSDRLWDRAWTQVMRARGGYLKTLWSLPLSLRLVTLLPFAAGCYAFSRLMMDQAATEIAVTTERIVYKKGLVARHAGEISINRIEGVSVQQDALGRMLGYGSVCIRGMGVGEVMLPPIASPIAFCKAVNEAKSLMDRGGARNDGF
jgi:hypothetical protein